MARGPLRVEVDHARRYPGADKLATECVINLIRTVNLVTAEVERILRRHGLTGPGFNLLMIVEGAGGSLSPHEIGERRLVTRGTVTGVLDTLEKQGWVRRIQHPEDRRRLLIELTDRGRRTLSDACEELFPAQAEMIAVLNRQKKAELVGALGKLQDHLGAGAQGGRRKLDMKAG